MGGMGKAKMSLGGKLNLIVGLLKCKFDFFYPRKNYETCIFEFKREKW
jgi:hypothetical protein